MSGDPGAWVMPARFEQRHVLELERRYRQLSGLRAGASTYAGHSRGLSLVALVILLCAAAYLRFGTFHVRELTTPSLWVVDGAGGVVVRLESSRSDASLLLTRGGLPAASFEMTRQTGRFDLQSMTGTGEIAISANSSLSTTWLHLNGGPGNRGSSFGIVSLGANVQSELAIQGKDRAYARMSAAIGFGDMSVLQLVDMDVSNVELATFQGITRVNLGHAFATEVELMLHSRPSLTVGRAGGPTARMGLGETQLDVPDQGEAWLLADDNGGFVSLSDDRLKSTTHLRPTLIHRLGDGPPAELTP